MIRNGPSRGELRGRTLLIHVEKQFRQQGLALSFAWQPDPSNRGPSLSMSHAVGITTSVGMDALLQPVALEELAGYSSNGQRFAAEMAYGLPAANDRLTTLSPVALALSPHSTPTAAVGAGSLLGARSDGTMGNRPGRGTAATLLLRCPHRALPQTLLLPAVLMR
ncbi:MAG: hypothetical protein OXF67_10190 [Cyanobacteria bacterium MAG CAR4_bin_6]|nr:hypothetical protein [Cyanobacteria bacterium MAG CAR4_bin_6]